MFKLFKKKEIKEKTEIEELKDLVENKIRWSVLFEDDEPEGANFMPLLTFIMTIVIVIIIMFVKK